MTTLVSRSEWGAKAAQPGIGSLTPSFGTTVHYEGGSGLDIRSHDRCPSIVRGIQAFHMAPVSQGGRGWLDVAYTGLACPHDHVYEGRWIGLRTAAQGTNEGNGAAYALCALLDTNDPLAPGLLDALVGGIRMLRHPGAGRGVNGHRDWHPTACPRDDLYGHIPELRRRADGTPTPAPSAPEEDDMPRTYVVPVPWMPDPPGRAPHFVITEQAVPTQVAAASVNNAPFDPPWKDGQKGNGWEDFAAFGLWWRRFTATTGKPTGALAYPDSVSFTCEGGSGTYTLARKPA